MSEKLFNIVRFTADERRYLPASMLYEEWISDKHISHTSIDIELGQSRYGGPVIDLPTGFSQPTGLRFAGQFDLAKFALHDKTGLLPLSGQLIFFADITTDSGKVFFVDVLNNELVRHIVEHDDNFFEGVLIDDIYSATENWDERFDEDDLWVDFAGSEKSKIFGIYTHCHYTQREIEEITFSEKIVLLQVGEDGFNDEGVLSVLIPQKDLINRDFSKCEFAWAQS